MIDRDGEPPPLPVAILQKARRVLLSDRKDGPELVER
jgi:hypothetical protein